MSEFNGKLPPSSAPTHMADWATPDRASIAATSAATPNTYIFFFMIGPPLNFLNTVSDLESDEELIPKSPPSSLSKTRAYRPIEGEYIIRKIFVKEKIFKVIKKTLVQIARLIQVANPRAKPTRPLRVKKAGGRRIGSRTDNSRCCTRSIRELTATAPA